MTWPERVQRRVACSLKDFFGIQREGAKVQWRKDFENYYWQTGLIHLVIQKQLALFVIVLLN